MLQSLAPLAQRLPVLDSIDDPDSSISDALATIVFRLQQLDQYVVAQFAFGMQSLENDIKDYTALLQEYEANVHEKIDFLIDIGHVRGGWDLDIASHLEEVLNDIIYYSNYVVQATA